MGHGMASRAYVDTIGGRKRLYWRKDVLRLLMANSRKVYQGEAEKKYPRQERLRWTVHGPNALALVTLINETAEDKLSISHIQIALDIEADSTKQAMARARWIGKHQIKTHTRRETVSNFSTTDYIDHREEGKQKRGIEFTVYGDEPSRHNSRPVTHIEFRIFGAASIRRVFSKAAATPSNLHHEHELLKVLNVLIDLRKVDWRKMVRQISRRSRKEADAREQERLAHLELLAGMDGFPELADIAYPPKHRYVPRDPFNIIRPVGKCKGKSQNAVEKFRRWPGFNTKVWLIPVIHPPWLKAALAPRPMTINTTSKNTTTFPPSNSDDEST